MKKFFKELLGNEKKLILYIFLLAFFVRLMYVLTLKDGFYFSDARHYDKAAMNLINGLGFGEDYDRAPFYPMLMAIIYFLLGKSFLLIRVVQSILGAFTCAIIYKIGKKTFSQKVGIIATSIYIFYPTSIFISGLLYPTALFTFLIALIIFFALKIFETYHTHYAIIVGLLLGMASLTKPSMLLFFPFLAFWFFWFLDKPFWNKVYIILITFIIAMMTLAPWTIRNYLSYNRFVIIESRMAIVKPESFENNLSQKKQNELSSKVKRNEQPKVKIMNIFGNPKKIFKKFVGEFIHFWALYPDKIVTKSKDYRLKIYSMDKRMVTEHRFTSEFTKYISILSFGPILIFSFIGLVASLSHWRTASLLFFVIMSFAIGYSFFFTQVRYRIPIEPYIIIFAGFGYVMTVKYLKRLCSNIKYFRKF